VKQIIEGRGTNPIIVLGRTWRGATGVAHLAWRYWRGVTGVAQMAGRLCRGAIGCSANGNTPLLDLQPIRTSLHKSNIG
jgi:hypothetical protein